MTESRRRQHSSQNGGRTSAHKSRVFQNEFPVILRANGSLMDVGKNDIRYPAAVGYMTLCRGLFTQECKALITHHNATVQVLLHFNYIS